MCVYVCMHVCLAKSGHLFLPHSLLLPQVITASRLQIQLQWVSSQLCCHQRCDLGQGAQPLCASSLMCDIGW